jgi:hypothetical protein
MTKVLLIHQKMPTAGLVIASADVGAITNGMK